MGIHNSNRERKRVNKARSRPIPEARSIPRTWCEAGEHFTHGKAVNMGGEVWCLDCIALARVGKRGART